MECVFKMQNVWKWKLFFRATPSIISIVSNPYESYTSYKYTDVELFSATYLFISILQFLRNRKVGKYIYSHNSLEK